MLFFRRSSKTPAAPEPSTVTGRQYAARTEADAEADRQALERGEIPAASRQRVSRTVSGELPWVSTLDIQDLYLADDLRIVPVAQVAGSCYYHAATDGVGNIYLDSNYDATNLIRAYYEAKERAVERLIAEARIAGAHAVVAARYRFHRQETLVEFSIVGTAVEFTGVRPPATPLVSPLSGEEFYKLLGIGYMPAGLALGYHWHCLPVGFQTRWAAGSWQNQELTAVTEKLMQTRESALRRMRQDAQRLHRVDGIVGVSVKTGIEETEIRFYRSALWDSGVTVDGTFYPYDEAGVVDVPAFNTEFFATGAAVLKVADGRVRSGDVEAFLLARDA